jgi:hypothetical protein
MPSCSKAPRGLFVLLRVGRVFTATSTSPGLWLRQRPTRYAFRAGRNLPDKEFRYLRTVIVTAAVHRGFGSKLAPLPLTFRHWAGVSPYTSVFTFAETCVFGKQSVGPFSCHRFSPVTLLPKLRVHVAEFLNQSSPVRLGLLDLPTSVGLRYGRIQFIVTQLFSATQANHFRRSRGSLTHLHVHSEAGHVWTASLLGSLDTVTEY